MALSEKLLVDGEREILTVRTHLKSLVWSVLVLVVVCGVAGFGIAVVGDEGDGIVRWIILGVAVVLILWQSLLPFLRWLTTTYHITNRRLVQQTGIINRTGRIIPLSRINHVTFDKDLIDRILRCGTLVVVDASESEGLTLPDVPRVEDVHRTLTQLVFDSHEGLYDEDDRPGGRGGRHDR